MKYIIERMWMVVGNTTVEADTPREAAEIVLNMPLPTVTEAVEDTARIVDVYHVN
jgi:hypothetical protein